MTPPIAHIEPTPPPLRAFGAPLEPVAPPLCPELTLWLVAGTLDLEARCHALRECEPPPYWAFCWGSGQALARFVLDHPERVRGRRVADIGSGCGVAAIAAARAGALEVVAVDRDPNALVAARYNAIHNGVSISTASAVPEDRDLLLAGDVLYEAANLAWIEGLRAGGLHVLLSDPERTASPRFGLAPMVRYAVTTRPDVDSPVCSAAVFDLAPGGPPLLQSHWLRA